MRNHDQQAGEKLFVEETAITLESIGLPRMAGRILGYLLISNPPHQSADEMMEALSSSRGSRSAMTRMLVQMEMIERLSLPGIRHNYFRLRSGAWEQLIKSGIAGKFRELRRLSERGLELLKNEPSGASDRLREGQDLFAFVEKEYPALIERWKSRRKRAKR